MSGVLSSWTPKFHPAMVAIKDEKVGGTPAGWADYGDHGEIRDYLKAMETA